MRLFISILTFCAAFPSLSQAAGDCPRWDGHYTCTYKGSFGHHVFELDMKTTDERGQTVYVANGKKVYPDGNPQHTDSLPILEKWANNIDYVASCEGGDKININGQATVKKNGQRANVNGYMQDQGDGRVAVNFNVKVSFFNLNFSVPCDKQ